MIEETEQGGKCIVCCFNRISGDTSWIIGEKGRRKQFKNIVEADLFIEGEKSKNISYGIYSVRDWIVAGVEI